MPSRSLKEHSRTTIYLPAALVRRLLAYTERTGRNVNVSQIAQNALAAYLDHQDAEEEAMFLFRGSR